MAQKGLLQRLYDQYGGKDRLTKAKKKEIENEFVKKFLPDVVYHKSGFLRKLFPKRISKIFSESDLVNLLIKRGLATDEKDARGLIPEIVSREYNGEGNINHYEFQPVKRVNDKIYYEMKTYLWNI